MATTLDPDTALASLRAIIADFKEFCAQHGSVSEADTRAQVIDRIIHDVCAWPRADVTREEHVERGYVDYVLTVRGRKWVVVEAKKEGVPFVIATAPAQKRLKLSGAISSDAKLRDAIEQARGYCDDSAIRYGIATNGYTWVVFRAIREDMPWREGRAFIFPSLEYIATNFLEFWKLLSYEAISAGSLDEEFGSSLRTSRELHRVSDRLFNADLPLQRNRLHAQLNPVIQALFEDIGEQQQVEILRNCYVHAKSLRIVATDLNIVIEDDIPKFLAHEGTVDADEFRWAVPRAIDRKSGQLLLLLGGIGAGKTTFLRRYQRLTGERTLGGRTLWFHVDFLKAPVPVAELENFIWEAVLKQFRVRYSGEGIEQRKVLKKIFFDKIEALRETVLSHSQPETPEYEQTLSAYLDRWQHPPREYVPRLLRFCRYYLKRSVVVFVDNVDQLSPDYQAKIFLLAQRVTREGGTVTIVALREESYYAASVQKAFTAYTNHKFHIASPHFRAVVGNRIRYAIDQLRRSPEESVIFQSSGMALDRDAIGDFLGIVGYSTLDWNRNIARFVESVCFGNMRLALQMFTTFLVSGATDVDKMIRIYRRDGAYYVPFHEFAKSVMLGDRAYYKESQSPIMNVFNCGAEKNSSHFTSIRILRYLLARRGESSSQGQGYVDVMRMAGAFEDVFDAREDFLRAMDSLVAHQLIETNTRSTETAIGASHVRATSSGWYYLTHLIHRFSYLDLVLQDTPYSTAATEREIRHLVQQVDNLGDRDEDKLERLNVRFERVERFLRYLGEEEEDERKRFELARRDRLLSESISERLQAKFKEERAWILRRARENRERYADEEPGAAESEDDSQIESQYLAEDDASSESLNGSGPTVVSPADIQRNSIERDPKPR